MLKVSEEESHIGPFNIELEGVRASGSSSSSEVQWGQLSAFWAWGGGGGIDHSVICGG